jgi:outer membrane biosynthesis protein TonB
MPDGPDDLDVDLDGAGTPDEGPILSPEELDISDDEHVTQLDEGRFVVSPDSRSDGQQQSEPQQPAPSNQSGANPQEQPQPQPERPRQQPQQPRRSADSAVTGEQAHQWLRQSFAQGNSRYGFDVTAVFDGSVSQRRMASNDVVTIFESLILWYAQQVDSQTPVEEVLGILLMEANVPIRYPPASLQNLIKSSGLDPDDTIEDLLAAVSEEDGVKL